MMPHHTQIEAGWTVYSSDGKKIGGIKNCTESYCHIDTGFLGLGPDYYVPMNHIRDVRPGEVYLSVSSDRVESMGWDREPVGGLTAGAGSREFGGTMPAGGHGDSEFDRGEQRHSMDLKEESLDVNRYREQAGEVSLGKDVIEERRDVNVPVTHEEAHIRQRDVDRPTSEPLGEGETIRVPLSEEHVDVEKKAHVYGEVEVEKRKVTDQRQVSDTVRKEVPRVSKSGDVEEEDSDDPSSKFDDESRRRAS
jgi:uncharacterized protein (TIGR02271 family)